MEADWEVEIGPESPVIEGLWPGYVDLLREPWRIGEISEASSFPPLAAVLLQLNASLGLADKVVVSDRPLPMWTAKCDRWVLDPGDPDEMGAEPASCVSGSACYLDLLPRENFVFLGLREAEQWARDTIRLLRETNCSASRVDLVIRQALAGSRGGFGATAYLTACGPTPETADQKLGTVLEVFCAVLSGRTAAKLPPRSLAMSPGNGTMT